ncbi:MAG: hypothetical protein JWM74_2447 [Myxococcaceae bacterium]|nr:hypothetical protein [Myxococcaceae bacterium]
MSAPVKPYLHTLRAWLVGVLLVLTVTLGGPRRAFAADVESAPQDAPLVLHPTSIKIPDVPTDYAEKDLGWLHVRYVRAAEERMAPVFRDADAMKEKIANDLGQPVLDHVELRVARTASEMATLAPEDLPPPAYASGVAYPPLHLMLLTLESPDAGQDAPDIEEVFRHELVHVALEDAVLGQHVPRWFNEGLAVHESGESRFARTKTLWDATLAKTILPLSDLDQGFPRDRYEVNIAYAESADFVRFLLRDADRARFTSLIERVRQGTSFDRALTDAYGTDVRKLEYQWREELGKRYTMLPIITGGSLIWVFLFFAMIYGYIKRRRRAKATLDRWEIEEAAVDAAIAEAEERERVLLASNTAHAAAAGGPRAALPVVEHDGTWHTLH